MSTRRYRTPSPSRKLDAPNAPTKVPALKTPESKTSTSENAPAISNKPRNPQPMSAASYIYETPSKPGSGFDPQCGNAPRKNRVGNLANIVNRIFI